MDELKGCAINASNLHVGGGVQVAASVICELASNKTTASGLAVVVSSAVDRNLAVYACDVNCLGRYVVQDVYGIEPPQASINQTWKSSGKVFTLFGPLYRWNPPFRSIVGFAQPWIIYPQNECYKRLPIVKRLKAKLKFWIQAQFFKRADTLVVELEHVKEGLVRELEIAPERIHVVHNCLSSLYLDEKTWQPVSMPEAECDLKLGYLGRNYMHKNTEMFPAIARSLEAAHGIRTRFYVTFTEDEWLACSPDFRAVCINVGPLNVAQCPSFYRGVDAVIFPSLLECFSATPLEAMAMEKPLFASDRPFNRDICAEHAHYFDPLSPESIADVIAGMISGGGPDKQALQRARKHAEGFSNPRERAQKYLSILMDGQH